MFGRDGNDRVYGKAGDDDIRGDAGSDFLQGGAGDDRVRGDKGFDKLQGSKGDDQLEGGLGADTFQFKQDWGTDTVMDFEDGHDKLRFFGLEFDDLTIGAVGADAHIETPDGFGLTVIVKNTAVSDLTEADFIFT